jgi:hypothetical protein
MFWIVIFLAVTLVWLAYLVVVRPVVLDSIEQELAEMRARVDWSIIEGVPSSQSKAVHRLLQGIHRGRGMSFSEVLYYAIRHSARINAEIAKDIEVFGESPKWIRDMRDRTSELAIKAALINSPAWWGPIALLLFMGAMSVTFAQWRRRTEAAAIIREQEGVLEICSA